MCAVVLAAGLGSRLRPLTAVVPKPLLPVGGVPLLGRALALVADWETTVNVHYCAELVAAHVGSRARVSYEPTLLGSSGTVASLKSWIAGRAVLVLNSDAYLHGGDVSPLLAGWDGVSVRMLTVPAGCRRPEFGDRVFAGASLLPWSVVRDLPEGFSHLVHTVWRPAEAAGQLELCDFNGIYIDCGTVADYAAANILSRLNRTYDFRSIR